MIAASRSPDIMADAAVAILSRAASDANGQCYIDVDVLDRGGRRTTCHVTAVGPIRSATSSWTGNTRRLSQCHRVERRSGFQAGCRWLAARVRSDAEESPEESSP